MQRVWGYRAAGSTRTLDSHASRLRRRLEARGDGDERWIVNHWGVGYALRASRCDGADASASSIAVCAFVLTLALRRRRVRRAAREPPRRRGARPPGRRPGAARRGRRGTRREARLAAGDRRGRAARSSTSGPLSACVRTTGTAASTPTSSAWSRAAAEPSPCVPVGDGRLVGVGVDARRRHRAARGPRARPQPAAGAGGVPRLGAVDGRRARAAPGDAGARGPPRGRRRLQRAGRRARPRRGRPPRRRRRPHGRAPGRPRARARRVRRQGLARPAHAAHHHQGLRVHARAACRRPGGRPSASPPSGARATGSPRSSTTC